MSSSFFIICVLLVKIFLRGYPIIWIANSFRSVAKTRSSVEKSLRSVSELLSSVFESLCSVGETLRSVLVSLRNEWKTLRSVSVTLVKEGLSFRRCRCRLDFVLFEKGTHLVVHCTQSRHFVFVWLTDNLQFSYRMFINLLAFLSICFIQKIIYAFILHDNKVFETTIWLVFVFKIK
jgi:hypothetical protein